MTTTPASMPQQPPAPVPPAPSWQPPQQMGGELPPQGPMLNMGPYMQPVPPTQIPAKQPWYRTWWVWLIIAVVVAALAVGGFFLTRHFSVSGGAAASGTPTQQALAKEAKLCDQSDLAIRAGHATECTVTGNTLNITQELGSGNDYQGDVAGAMGRAMWGYIYKTYEVSDFEVHYKVLFNGELRDEDTVGADNHETLTGDSEIRGRGNYMDENGNFHYANNGVSLG